MADPISGDHQRALGITPNKGVKDTDSQSVKLNSPAPAPAPQAHGKDSSVDLTAELRADIAAADFDQKKVEAIRASLEEGNYPLDNAKIADNFIPLEKLL